MMVVYTIIILCILIFFHELGHFIAAKASGVKVNQFALGMGPAFLKKQVGETEYSLRIFPIGGFCAMEGEDGDSDDSRAMSSKPPAIKAIILVAGSVMNVLLALIILWGLLFYAGSPTTAVDKISPGSPAALAGMQTGDKIISVNGAEIKSWTDIPKAINAEGTVSESNRAAAITENLTIELERQGKPLTLEVAVALNEEGRKIIGITPQISHNPIKAAGSSVIVSVEIVKGMYEGLAQLITGKLGTENLTGPVGIAYIVDDSVNQGLPYVAYLVALISLNLAIVNMLPFPALDGGRLLFLVIRLFTGGRLTDEMEGRIHFAGIFLLFALMIYVTWNDIGRYILGNLS